MKPLSFRILIAAATIIVIESSAISGKNNTLNAEQKLAWEAARALYGEGLSIKRTKTKLILSPKSGGLTQEKFNKYVETIYIPALGANPKGHLAKVLLDPRDKASLCKTIAYSIGDVPTFRHRFDRQNWCAYQGMMHAMSPVFEYRGTKISWDANLDGGELKATDRIFVKDADGNYPIIVTIRGSREKEMGPVLSTVRRLHEQIDQTASSDKKLYATAQRYWKTRLNRHLKSVRQAKAKQRQLAKGKIIFSETSFYEGRAVPAAKGPIDCRKSFFTAYSPKRSRKHGYQFSAYVDGTQCADNFMDVNDRFSGAIHEIPGCFKKMKTGESHKLKIAVHHNIITGNHARVEHHDGKLRRRVYDQSKRGRKLYGTQITCNMTTP